MSISLKPQHLKRYHQIAWLLAKYGRSDLVKDVGLDEILTAEEVAKLMKVNIRSVRDWVSTGDLAVIMVGKREYRIRRSELNRFVLKIGKSRICK